jgi:hypothetical protein
LHLCDDRVHVVAHEKELVCLAGAGRVQCELCRGEPEDQPAMSGVDIRVLEDIAEKCAIGLM